MVFALLWTPKVPLKALAKTLYNTSPDIVFGAAHGLVGLVLIGYTVYMTRLDPQAFTKKYRMQNIVVRSDDPRAQNLKRTCGLDIKE